MGSSLIGTMRGCVRNIAVCLVRFWVGEYKSGGLEVERKMYFGERELWVWR